MARPELPKEKKKSKYVRVRVTTAERLKILNRAKAAKARTEAEWIRERLLGGD